MVHFSRCGAKNELLFSSFSASEASRKGYAENRSTKIVREPKKITPTQNK
ncbi:MAG: hypothetical protein U5L45_21085 [Saprospiraceae bacterium]|nr:hypothetical protein [Saprospiraceae bacterium]